MVYQTTESGSSKTTSVSNEKDGSGLTVAEAAAKAAPSTVAVSYTHLDVYKRQILPNLEPAQDYKSLFLKTEYLHVIVASQVVNA